MNRRHLRLARRGGRVALLLVAGALLLAACSSTPSARRIATKVGTTSTTTSTTLPTSSNSTTTSSAPAATTACVSTHLTVAEDEAKSTAGAGSADVAYTLTNSGATPCTLSGYPTVKFYGPPSGSTVGTGAELHLSSVHSGPAGSAVVLDAGGVGAFYLVVGNVPVDGTGCVTVGSLSVGLPGGGGSLTVASALQPCGPSVGVTSIEPLAQLST